MSNRNRGNRPWWRRGSVALVTVITVAALAACAALSLDVGYVCALTAEQQNNADAASLAGAAALQGNTSVSVIDHVHMVLGRNQESQGFLSLSDQLVEVGTWDSIEERFRPLDSTVWAERAFAVRVRAVRSDVSLLFARLLGLHTASVWRQAVTIGSRPCRGLWGLQGISVFGNVVTDSYDATEGCYRAESAGDGGDVCSGRGIEATGSLRIRGDVMAGMSHAVNISGGGAEVTGITTISPDGMEGLDVDLGETGNLENQGDLIMTGTEVVTLEPGRYRYESVTQQGGSSLTINGPTTIYVSGDVVVGGSGIVNITRDPADLTLIVQGMRVMFEGRSEFYGTVIAPNADVSLSGTGDYFGAVIGRTLELRGDLRFHVDESLPALDMIPSPPPILVQ